MSAGNKEIFYGIGRGTFIPEEISYYAPGLTLMGDALDERRLTLSQKVAEFIARAPRFLQDRLFYRPYCKEEGLMTKRIQHTPPGEFTIEVPVKYNLILCSIPAKL